MPPRIMVVDDDRDIRDTLNGVLQDAGYEVDCVRNGQEALTKLREGQELPVTVLLDLRMPVMDGRTFLSIRARDPAIAAIPIIVITADGDCSEVLRTFRVQDCLHKPFAFDLLITAVQASRGGG